jgi:hypothetical protein
MCLLEKVIERILVGRSVKGLLFYPATVVVIVLFSW